MSVDFSAFTDNVIKAIGEKASPRVKQALSVRADPCCLGPDDSGSSPILIRKLHEFVSTLNSLAAMDQSAAAHSAIAAELIYLPFWQCIEADVSVEEWMQACNLMVEAGKVSSEQRNEVVLVTDVLVRL